MSSLPRLVFKCYSIAFFISRNFKLDLPHFQTYFRIVLFFIMNAALLLKVLSVELKRGHTCSNNTFRFSLAVVFRNPRLSLVLAFIQV